MGKIPATWLDFAIFRRANVALSIYPTPVELLADRVPIITGRLAVAGEVARALLAAFPTTDYLSPGYSVTVGGEGRKTVRGGSQVVIRLRD